MLRFSRPEIFFFFLEEAFGRECLQIGGGLLMLGDVGCHQVADPKVGMHEDQFCRFAGVDFRYPVSKRTCRLVEDPPDRAD